ncbi:hypothetical protein ACLESD_04780 [Pyxidicoccus sp. 3LFB2]
MSMPSVWLSDFDVRGRHVHFDVRENHLVQLEEKQLHSEELRRYPLDGRFAELGGALYAFFSSAGTNFLALPGRILEVTSKLTVEYACGEDGEESWIRFLDAGVPFHEVRYVSPHGPLVWSFPDWDVVNFAFHLHRDVNRAHEIRGTRVYTSRGQ